MNSGKWLADDTVGSERVYKAKFPANREINREFVENGSFLLIYGSVIDTNSGIYRANSLQIGTGN